MWTNLNRHKVRSEHLERQAFIYVRQSTLMQVRQNTASTARQYDLVQQALELGWGREQVVMVDQDQGCSGASAVGRKGFQWLVAEVGLGHAGAVLSLEASRLARSSSDWYRLIEICALTHTLVIDEEGIYDPGDYNDRLLLGFKGTMSEAELHWLRSRLLGGKLEKARQGQLRFHPPTGFVCNREGQFILDPDEQVQQAVHLVFDLFAQTRSAMGVVRHFNTHHLLFPTRLWGGVRADELVWQPLKAGRVLEIIHNPAYAGSYVYGRTQTRLVADATAQGTPQTRQVKREAWPIVLHQAHPAYITWEQFLQHQQQLDDNRTDRNQHRRGAVREGAALLQGILLCGICGRRMTVRYPKGHITPCYTCDQAHKQAGVKTCQFIGGGPLDTAVTQAFLAAIEPAQLELSLTALGQLEARSRQIDQQWQLRLERAQYEANLARRRFTAVDPENRLVARTLEREWNEKLLEVQQLERDYQVIAKPTYQVTPEMRQRIRVLAQDLPAIWHAPTTTAAQRKQLVRFLIRDVTVTKREATIHLGIRWQTEATTELTIAGTTRQTPGVLVERIRQLAMAHHSDAQIANLLNQAGLKTSRNLPFTAARVLWVRQLYHIPTGDSKRPDAYPTGQRGDGRYTVQAAAKLLNVQISTLNHWCRAGRLDALHEGPHTPYWIRLTPETIAQLRKPAPELPD